MEENQYQKLYHINNSKQTQVKGNQLEEKAKMITMGSIESKYYDYEEDIYSKLSNINGYILSFSPNHTPQTVPVDIN